MLDWDWHLEHFAPAQSPACTRRPTKTPLEERRLKLSMHYYLKTRTCTDNPAHYALHEFDPTTRDLYLSKPNGKGGMTRAPTQPVGLKVEGALTSAEIDAEWSAPWRCQAFHLEHMNTILRDTASLKYWVNLWSQEKRFGPNSMSITML